MKINRQQFLTAFFLGVITLLVYWPLSTHQFINVDDPQYILLNPKVTSGLTWSGVLWACGSGYAANWHPLTWISHMLDCSLYGLNPAGHHFTNLLFHIANTLLVFLLINRMTGALWRSFFVAGFFAWHPLHVESVAWAAERKDVLSTFFFLLTLLAYLRYAQAVQPSEAERGGRKTEEREQSALDRGETSFSNVRAPSFILWYLLALGLFALGLMSKPMLVTLPFVLLLLDYWPLQRLRWPLFRSSKPSLESPAISPGVAVTGAQAPVPQPRRSIPQLLRLILEKVPFFLLAFGASFVTFAVQKQGGAFTSLALSLRLSNALVSYWRYIGKTFWPAKLAEFYPLPDHFAFGLVLTAGLLLAAVCVWILLQARRRPYLLTGWFWFLGTLVPTLGIVQVGSQAMADRYTYIPSIGLFLVLVLGIHELAARARLSAGLFCAFRWGRPFLACLGGIALAGCLICTSRQLSYWQNPEKLFRHTIAVTSDNYVAYDYLGAALHDVGKFDEALAAFRASVQITPRFPQSQCNLGTILLEHGDLEESVAHLTAALEMDPGNGDARRNLGDALTQLNKLPEAISQLSQAIAAKPNDVEAHCKLGTALWNQSRFEEAAAQFSEATRLNPAYIPAHQSLAVALIRLGRREEGINQFSEAVRLDPNDSELRFNVGLALLEDGRVAEAESHLRAGLKLRPDDPRLHYRIAQALTQQGRTNEAIVAYREALRLVPNFPEAAAEVAKLEQK